MTRSRVISLILIFRGLFKMGKLLNIITPLHKSASRDYAERMAADKIHSMEVARRFDREFWDGKRNYGYGGYSYDGRWAVVAEKLIDRYKLSDGAKILDVGCGKGFLLYEFTRLLPGAMISGFDISSYALDNAKEEVKPNLFHHRAEEPLPFEDNEIDLTLSLTTLHNLPINNHAAALSEIERVSRKKYITLDSYRNPAELYNLQCWALTCECFFTPDEWVWLFERFGYTGDYEFIFFE